MRQYLSTIHTRSHSHKKRFAFVTAASFTFLIFAIWAVVKFGTPEPTPASANRATEANPFGSVIRTLGAGFQVFTGQTEEMKKGLESVNSNNYGEFR